jgi:hypothetical protein
MSTSVAAPTRTVTATAIAIGIIGRYPCQCCCLSFPSFPLFSLFFPSFPSFLVSMSFLLLWDAFALWS